MTSNHHYQSLVKKILSEEPVPNLKACVRQLHPAELADLLEALPADNRSEIWQLLTTALKGETLLEVRGEVRRQLIRDSKAKELVAAVSKLQVDEIADLDQKLPKEVLNAIVTAMDSQKKWRYERIKDYPDDSAGGLMDVDAIAIRADITVFVALRYLRFIRKKVHNLPEHMNSVFVVDHNNKYLGCVELKDLVSLPSKTLIATVVNTQIKAIPVDTTVNKVVKQFQDQDLMSAPVVDDSNELIGRITIDDVVDVIRKQSEQMIMRPAGLSERTDVFSPVFESFKYRSIWLAVNLINAFVSAMVINLFTDSIEKIVALAVLMPVVASMGGVVGNQTLTLVTRGLALEQITKENTSKLLLKEIAVGFCNGFFWAFIVGIIVFIWLQNIELSLVFGFALLFSLLLSATAGTLIPIFLTKLKIDPALGGTVLLVAISDVAGFFIFLSIATLFLIK